MRTLIAALSIVSFVGIAVAEESKVNGKPGDASTSTGRTVVPSTQGIAQPQGPTGPLETTTGGAPAESPQGQTPPGMQAAPEGSDKTIVDKK